jgi:hypothetical protein
VLKIGGIDQTSCFNKIVGKETLIEIVKGNNEEDSDGVDDDAGHATEEIE